MKDVLKKKNILITIGLGMIICVVIVVLCLLHNKNTDDPINENKPDIASIYFRAGSSSVSNKYEFDKSGNEYILKYESFNCGKKDTKELKINSDEINNFIYNEDVVSKDYYENNQNEGAYNQRYFYKTKSGESVYLKISEDTEKYFQDLIKK